MSSAKSKLEKGIITKEEYTQIVNAQKVHDRMEAAMNGLEDITEINDEQEEEEEEEKNKNENESWQELVDPNGTLYYYNKSTETTQWNKPSSFTLPNTTNTTDTTNTTKTTDATDATDGVDGVYETGKVNDLNRTKEERKEKKNNSDTTKTAVRMSRIQKYLEKKRQLETKKQHVEHVIQTTLLPRQRRASINTEEEEETKETQETKETTEKKKKEKEKEKETKTKTKTKNTLSTEPPPEPSQKKESHLTISRGVNDDKVYEAITMLHGFLYDHQGHIRRQIAMSGLKKTRSQGKHEFTFAEKFSMLLNRLGAPDGRAVVDDILSSSDNKNSANTSSTSKPIPKKTSTKSTTKSKPHTRVHRTNTQQVHYR